MFKLYLKCFGKSLSESQKLKYLQEFIKKGGKNQKSNDISASEKVEILKHMVTEVVEFIANRIEDLISCSKNDKNQAESSDEDSSIEEESSKKFEILKVYLTNLVKACSFN